MRGAREPALKDCGLNVSSEESNPPKCETVSVPAILYQDDVIKGTAFSFRRRSYTGSLFLHKAVRLEVRDATMSPRILYVSVSAWRHYVSMHPLRGRGRMGTIHM